MGGLAVQPFRKPRHHALDIAVKIDLIHQGTHQTDPTAAQRIGADILGKMGRIEALSLIVDLDVQDVSRKVADDMNLAGGVRGAVQDSIGHSFSGRDFDVSQVQARKSGLNRQSADPLPCLPRILGMRGDFKLVPKFFQKVAPSINCLQKAFAILNIITITQFSGAPKRRHLFLPFR